MFQVYRRDRLLLEDRRQFNVIRRPFPDCFFTSIQTWEGGIIRSGPHTKLPNETQIMSYPIGAPNEAHTGIRALTRSRCADPGARAARTSHPPPGRTACGDAGGPRGEVSRDGGRCSMGAFDCVAVSGSIFGGRESWGGGGR